jgi:two-component system, LytTR family, sensor kinase
VSRAAEPDELPARLVLGSIAFFWAGWIVLMTARAVLLGFEEPLALLERRGVAAIAGGMLTLLFWRMLRRVRAGRPATLTLAALAGAVPATVAFAVVNWALFYAWPTASTAADVARWGSVRVFRYAVVDTSVSWFFFFAGWGLTYLFLAAAHRARQAERLGAEAELRALRYQLNPHFLFNALNTLADLVAVDAVAAERMVLDLSALLRRMLVDTPDATVPLAEEFALQRHYLAIEQRRFEGRLTVSLDLPQALANRCVPALILQPLVENAVKHGLDGAAPVRIAVAAKRHGAGLALTVRNTGPWRSTARSGFGIGLANTRDRLRLLHGPEATLVAGPADDGWCATIRLPGG